jgi:hypothetical protein
MTSISSVQQLVAVIRDQLSSRAPSASVGKGNHSAKAPAGSPGRENALESAAQRVRSIGKDDPDRGRKALRIFLESVLLAELDEGLMNDPEFHRMVDEVQRQMESDPGLAASIDSAIAQLSAPR